MPHVPSTSVRTSPVRVASSVAAALAAAAATALGTARGGAQPATPSRERRPTPAPAQPAPQQPASPRPTPAAAPAGALGDGSTGAALDTLLAAFRGDVTQLPPPAALRVVEVWQARLSASGDEQLADLAVDLGAVRAALAAPAVDRAVIATLLSRLAPKVAAAAPKAGDRAAQLRALGDALDRTAARLRAEQR